LLQACSYEEKTFRSISGSGNLPTELNLVAEKSIVSGISVYLHGNSGSLDSKFDKDFTVLGF
jgi:hypothetical protein